MAQPPSAPPSEPNAPQYSPRLRATAVLVVVVCLFAALFGRLWYLQGVEANTVAVKSVAGQGIETVLSRRPGARSSTVTGCSWRVTRSSRW